MKFIAFALLFSLVPCVSSTARAELTPDQRENLKKNTEAVIDEAMQSEALGMTAEANLEAQGGCGLSRRECYLRTRLEVAKLLKDAAATGSPEYLASLNAEIDDLNFKLSEPEARQAEADNLKPVVEAAQHVLDTGDTELDNWDKLSEFGRLGQTLKYQVHQLYQPGPLLLLAAGTGAWAGLKAQNGINQSIYNEFHGKVTLPQGIVTTGQWTPFAAVGAIAPVYILSLKTNNEELRDFSEAVSIAVAEDFGASTLLKALAKDCRPGPVCMYKNGYPSEHSSISFAIATVVDRKFGHKWGAIAYVAASAVVLTRLANHDPANVHTFGQTIGGGVIGGYFGWTASNGQSEAKKAHSSKLGSLLSHCQPVAGPGILAGSCAWQSH